MKKTIFCFILISLSLPMIGNSQSSNKLKTLKSARELIFSAKSCALITIDKEGQSNVRAMDSFAPEEDFTVWLGTNSNSRKVQQIMDNPQVTLYYVDSTTTGYVTMQGRAQIINDVSMKEKYWKEAWKDFYPNFPLGYSLIKVIPNWLEIVSEAHDILGDSLTWKPRRVVFDVK